MSGQDHPTAQTVESFMKKLIIIEEKPVHMHGAQDTARQKQIYDALQQVCEANT
jgi:hypothetical protein